MFPPVSGSVELSFGPDMAGHRTPEPHDCFLLNCKGLGAEVGFLMEALARKDIVVAAACDWTDKDYGDPNELIDAALADAVREYRGR